MVGSVGELTFIDNHEKVIGTSSLKETLWVVKNKDGISHG